MSPWALGRAPSPAQPSPAQPAGAAPTRPDLIRLGPREAQRGRAISSPEKVLPSIKSRGQVRGAQKVVAAVGSVLADVVGADILHEGQQG